MGQLRAALRRGCDWWEVTGRRPIRQKVRWMCRLCCLNAVVVVVVVVVFVVVDVDVIVLLIPLLTRDE